jgi:hypothetical protein
VGIEGLKAICAAWRDQTNKARRIKQTTNKQTISVGAEITI